MTELKRWTEEGAPEAIERLLQAAESEEPSAASLASTLASLGVASALTSVTSSAAAGGAAGSGAATSGSAALAGAGMQGKLSGLALTASLAKWIALGSVVSGAAVVAMDTMFEEAPPVSSVGTLAAPHPPPSPASAAVDQTASVPTASAGVEPAVASKTELPRTARAPVARGAPPPMAAETLAAEIAGIDRARSLLAAGRYSATRVALDDYERRFPRHHFGPEVLYLRMEAATGAGRPGEAQRLAHRLLASYPESPQSERAKQLLGQKK